jgi:hypothetical protein
MGGNSSNRTGKSNRKAIKEIHSLLRVLRAFAVKMNLNREGAKNAKRKRLFVSRIIRG